MFDKLRQRESFLEVNTAATGLRTLHAEETIFVWLKENPDWVLEVGASSRNICKEICAKIIDDAGHFVANLKFGRPGAITDATDFRIFF